MRAISLALLGAVTFAALGSTAEAQGRYGSGYVRVSQPLPIRIRPRSWLDAGNVTEEGNGSVANPATDPRLITASYLNAPPYGIANRERFAGAGILPDAITNGPFIGARSTAIRRVDFSGIDAIDPTSYVSRTGMNPYR